LLHDRHAVLPGGVRLVPSSGGVLEISLGERTVFSKKAEGRFPEPEEVLTRFDEVVAASA
jgi:selenoprotein W-related protein